MRHQSDAIWKYDAALLFTVVVWGLNFPILKGALAAMPPHVINGFRFLVSASVLAALYFGRGHHRRYRPVASFRDHARAVLTLSFTGYVLYQLFFILGVDHTTAGNAALIMAGSPLWTAVFGATFRLERLPRSSWAGLVVVLVGTIIVVLGGAREIDLSNDTFVGNMLMLVAAMLWGGYTAFSRPVLSHLPATTLTFFAILLALPVLLGLGAVHLHEVVWSRVDLEVWAAILFSGGLSTGLVFVFWSAGVRRVGASQTAAFGNLVPLVAVAAGYLLLHEAIEWAQIVGGITIIGGLVVMRRSRRHATAPAAPD